MSKKRIEDYDFLTCKSCNQKLNVGTYGNWTNPIWKSGTRISDGSKYEYTVSGIEIYVRCFNDDCKESKTGKIILAGAI